MRENIYINKKSENRYEIITKETYFEPGVYTLYPLEKNLFVIKRQFFENKQNSQKKEKENTKESEQKNTNTERETNYSEINTERENDEIKENYKQIESKDSEELPLQESTKEWYKKGLELKKDLMRTGFLALSDLENARKISYVAKQEIANGEIIGIRGFDKIFYVFTKEYFEKIKTKILDSIKDTITYDELLENTNISKEELTGILELLKEQSDILEIKKGIFKKV